MAVYSKQRGLCSATGIRMALSSWEPLSISIDQIAPGRGYTKDNARFVIHAFNQAKGNMMDRDFELLCRYFLDARDKKEPRRC